MENISKIQIINADTLEFQDYQQNDESLISSFELNDIKFNPDQNLLEYYILDANKNVIFNEYNFKQYSLIDNHINIHPKDNLESYGFDDGQYYTKYNFVNLLFNSSPSKKYFISEISADRTELKLQSNVISVSEIIEGYEQRQQNISNLNYYPDFYLNFGNNKLVIANNSLIYSGSLLIKLYEPLSNQFDLKSEVWVVEKISDSLAYFIELITVFDDVDNTIKIKGPNFSIPLKDTINNSTNYVNLNLLQNSPSSSLSNQLNNILKNKSIRLNIDYSNYSNFIHYSSAQTRLENFVYKLSLIDTYNIKALSSSFSSTNYYLSSSYNYYIDKIKEIEEGFDGYEYHLYYNSGSTSWPKSNSIQPYINFPSTSSQGISWLMGQLDSASLYDSENKDSLINSIPLYLREDPNNAQYELYVEMLGQHFDIIYLYYTEISNKYNSDNRLNYGISRDLISDALKDFGIKIYQNNFSSNDLYSSFLGIDSNLNLLPPTGSELITNYITASNSVIPLDDVNNEIYKRIYHNLPLLLKKKGTVEGLRLLINIYGIPDTILRINEYGGKNKNNTNDWDYYQNVFNYAFYTDSINKIASGSIHGTIKYSLTPGSITSASLNSIELRFKTTGVPPSNYFSQSLIYIEPSEKSNLVIEYSGSLSSGSYSGSVLNNKFGTVKFITDLGTSASVSLPIFDENWWSVLLTYNNSGSIDKTTLYVKNNIYDGHDGNKIGFQASSSVSGAGYWFDTADYHFHLSLTEYSNVLDIFGKRYRPFNGCFQELRFYKTILSESRFDSYVMNPYSIEGNNIEGGENSLNSLVFRAPLGTDLDITSSTRISIHPSITASPPTQSFSGGSTYTLIGGFSFIPNREIIYENQFPLGIRNSISNKINISNNILPEGDVLSSFKSLQQSYAISESYTKDINYLEVAFSPQNEINDDIIEQLGYFNVGEYIGDPRQFINNTSSNYPNFDIIRNNYFKKYNSNFKLNDYIRLIRYFDNSLFKLIKDFTPARTNLASGVVIKQHLLERNKYPTPQISYSFEEYSSSIKSAPNNYSDSDVLYKLNIGNGGIYNFFTESLNNITQSYSESIIGPKGLSFRIHSTQEEFFNGELTGSQILVTTQSLNSNNQFLKPEFPTSTYILKAYYDVGELSFFESVPEDGEILFSTDFIKINKIDLQSINHGSTISQVTYIEISFSNNILIRYEINSKTDLGNYYVLGIVDNSNFYKPDNRILNYTVSSSNNTEFISFIPSSSMNTRPLWFNNTSLDVQGYFTGSFIGWVSPSMVGVTSSFFALRDYSNIPINFKLNITFDSWAGTYEPIISLYKTFNSPEVFSNPDINFEGELIESTRLPGQSGAVSHEINFTLTSPQKDFSYYIVISENSLSAITASNASLIISAVSASQSGSNRFVFYVPYTTQPFEGNDYNVLYSNIDKIPYSQYIFKTNNYDVSLPYFQSILSSSAEKSNVKDYYYNLRRYILPRYLGSRITSDNFNTSSISSSNALQSSLRLHLNPLNRTETANNWDSLIFEFDKVLNIPEISNFSKIELSKIMIVNDIDDVVSINKGNSNFNFIKNNALIPGDKIDLSFYSTNLSKTSNLIIYSTLLSPNISSYMIVTSASDFSDTVAMISGSNRAISTLVDNRIYSINYDESNSKYVSSSVVYAGDFISELGSSSLAGDEWYITFVTGSLSLPLDIPSKVTPLNIKTLATHSLIEDSLTKNGILKITSSSIESGYAVVYVKIPNSNNQFNQNRVYGVGGSMGAFIWKNSPINNTILINNSKLSGNVNGSFFTKNASPFVISNVDDITKNFGNSPKQGNLITLKSSRFTSRRVVPPTSTGNQTF